MYFLPQIWSCYLLWISPHQMAMNNSNLFFYQYLSSQQPCKACRWECWTKKSTFWCWSSNQAFLWSATRLKPLTKYFILSPILPNFSGPLAAHIPATQPRNVANMSVTTHSWHFWATFQLTRGGIYIFEHLWTHSSFYIRVQLWLIPQEQQEHEFFEKLKLDRLARKRK